VKCERVVGCGACGIVRGVREKANRRERERESERESERFGERRAGESGA
jgi:hypothetical protein